MRLTQVLNNLLHYAFKFSEGRGQVAITISVDSERQRVRLDVADSGIGIAPELLPHIFETFNQADRSLDRRQGGLGLGLALVKGLIELHGGSVHAASAGLGLGSRLGFELPLGKPATSNGKAHGLPGQKGKQLRILVVEDNLDAARTLSLLLERYGHQVRLAHAGHEGVDAAKNWLPEVVLCDLGLPGMDGYEVARTLRADPATASIQLIALSGYGYEEDRQRSRAAGFNLHLTKPADPEELKNLLSVLKVEAAKTGA
jgi:CheY-like chemotaxis protein